MLFFCLIIINCFTFFASQETPTVVFPFDFFRSEQSQKNTKYGMHATHSIPWSDQAEYYADHHKIYYASFSPQDFQQAFQDTSDINEILNQYPFYAFKNFLEFVRTLPGYEAHILLLHEKIKNDKAFKKKTARMPYFTYSFSCRHEKSGFHDLIAAEAQEIVNAAQQKLVSTAQQTIYYVPYQGLDILAEHRTLNNLYQTYLPCLSRAIEKRMNVFKSMTEGDCVLQYSSKMYSLNDNVKQLLDKYGQETTYFTQCHGDQLRQVLHQESLDLLDCIDTLSSNSILYDHQEALIDFAIAMTHYNHENEAGKAMRIGDFCWTLLDYGQAIAEGVVLGAYYAATDFLHNPLEASLNMIIGKQVLTYQLCKVLYNIAGISITALMNTNQARNKWDKYIEPLNTIINHATEKQLSIRDVLKGGAAFVVGYKAQSAFFGGLGKFCSTISQKVTRFAQNNISSFTIQQYLATPEGHLLRSVGKTSCGTSCPNQYEYLKQWFRIKEFTSVIKTTLHGIQRLIERGFTSTDVENVMKFPSFIKKQNDGALVYVKQIGEKFNVIVFNEYTKAVVTALKNTNQKKLYQMGKNYGWR